MSFIVKKNISGKDYYYLQQSTREGDKVKSKAIAYLGKDRKHAELKAKEIKKKIDEVAKQGKAKN